MIWNKGHRYYWSDGSNQGALPRIKEIGGGIYKEILFVFIITAIISLNWRMDMANNRILPFVPLFIGAVSGSFMVMMVSKLICRVEYLCFLSKILAKIGRETFLIMAFSQIIIVYLNSFFTFNVVVKYLAAILIMIICYYIKECLKQIKMKVI